MALEILHRLVVKIRPPLSCLRKMTAASQTEDLGLWSQVKVCSLWELRPVDVWVKPTNQPKTCPRHKSPLKRETIFCISIVNYAYFVSISFSSLWYVQYMHMYTGHPALWIFVLAVKKPREFKTLPHLLSRIHLSVQIKQEKERESVFVCLCVSSHAGLFIVRPRGNRFSGVRSKGMPRSS